MRLHAFASPALTAAAALTVCVLAGSGPANSESLAGSAAPYRLAGPVVQNNLAVYFVRGAAAPGAAPITLEQAVSTGAAKVFDTTNGAAVENLSNRDLFIQPGDLVTGGAQDQVIGSGLLVPPGSGRVPLEVYCVDPFRSSPRPGHDASSFTASGTLLSARMARLSMAAGPAGSKGLRYVRQLGVWWSIDSFRAALADALGGALEPPVGVETDGKDGVDARASRLLEARRSPSTAGLPLALRNEALTRAQDDYVDALAQGPDRSGDVVGAVFAIDGRLEAAEIYESNELFRAAWPKLLRAYATAAIAARQQPKQGAAPSIESAEAFLAGAQPMVSGKAAQASSGDSAAVFSGTVRPDGRWVHRAYLRRFDMAEAASSPEGNMLAILTSGHVNGRPIESLAPYENIVLHSDAGEWQAGIVPLPEITRIGLSGRSGSSELFPGVLMAGFVPVFFLLIRLVLVVCASLVGRVVPLARDALATAIPCIRHAMLAGGRSLRSGCVAAAAVIAFLLLSAMLTVVQAWKRLRPRGHAQAVPAAVEAWAQHSTP